LDDIWNGRSSWIGYKTETSMTLRISKRRVAAGLAGALALALTGAASAQTVKVGVVGPLSGASAVYGNESLEGARFALEQLKKKGTMGSIVIDLVSDDSAGNPGKAAQSTARMISSDNVVAMIGGSTSAETQAMVEVTKPAEVPQLSPLAQATNLTQQGNKWFARVSQTADEFASNAAIWAIERRKAKSVYLLVRNDSYGQSLADAFAKTVEARGIKVLGRVAYEPNARDFKPILATMKDANPDFVAIMGFYTDTGLIMKQMGELAIKVPTYANTAPAIPQFQDIAGPAANGAYGALYYFAGSINTEAGKAFLADWKAKYNREPTQYEGMGYDNMLVLAEAIKRASAKGKITRETVRDAIFTIKDFQGGTGPITILPNGDVKRPLPFVQLNDGKLALDFVIE
jgi:branched-chain amino acid transport system substrate-binding protein